MTRIGTVDQVLLLLREQLQRAGRSQGNVRGAAADRVRGVVARPLDRVRALAVLDTLDEEEVRRALVRGILTEELGEAVGNDASLQAIVDDVVRIIGEMPDGTALMDRAVSQLKDVQS